MPPFEPPGKYLEQRKEAPTHEGMVRLSEPQKHHKRMILMPFIAKNYF